MPVVSSNLVALYLIEILHQTTTLDQFPFPEFELYLIEILHQTTTRQRLIPPLLPVVSYRNSTSNHNFVGSVRIFVVLYLIEILHQTTTTVCVKRGPSPLYLIEILHQTTTVKAIVLYSAELYLIEILHQTTTTGARRESLSLLYLIEILHQTTTRSSTLFFKSCCILSKFYIKPQPRT